MNRRPENVCDKVFRSETQWKAGGTKSFYVWTSRANQSRQTALFFHRLDYETRHLSSLDEPGEESLDAADPRISKSNYQDDPAEVAYRIKSAVLEVERLRDHVLLIAGLETTRALLTYFLGLRGDNSADLKPSARSLYLIEPVSARI